MMCDLPSMKSSAGRSHGFRVNLRGILLPQVIMLDADNTPLKNPEALFESREYQTGGNLYWPDWWDAQGWLRPAAYTLFGITPPWMLEGGEGFRTAESGQMVLHRCCPHPLLVHHGNSGASCLSACFGTARDPCWQLILCLLSSTVRLPRTSSFPSSSVPHDAG